VGLVVALLVVFLTSNHDLGLGSNDGLLANRTRLGIVNVGLQENKSLATAQKSHNYKQKDTKLLNQT
jgi:hypothetical protein